MHNLKKIWLPLLMAGSLFLTACGSDGTTDSTADEAENTAAGTQESRSASFSASDIPAYKDEPYVEINGNVPYFTEDDLTTKSYKQFSDLDSLDRCGAAYGCMGQDLMPTEQRGDIHEVHPTGWHSTKYDFIDGENLYNRCHLLAYKLTGENANEKNLITGTRYFNTTGMSSFEDMVTDYIKETDNHVMYRVTPIFTGDNLVADGVLMEAESVEDAGESVLYCVFVYNVQPGVVIDYATGDNWPDESGDETADTAAAETDDEEMTYILNTGSMKFHLPSCEGVADISEHNKKEYTGSRQALIDEGYAPCGTCNP